MALSPVDREQPTISINPTYYMHCVSSCETRTSYVPCRQLLLTVWAGHVTINILPDDVLLLIFHFDRVTYLDGVKGVDRLDPSWRWHRLVHVCRRWRSVVFASPNFLHLKLVCRPRTPVGLLGIWPPLPITIKNTNSLRIPETYDFDAALVHHNRVCEVDLRLTRLQMQQLASAMQKQFPALTDLALCYTGRSYHDYGPAPALPDGFLGGSAPRLQSLKLDFILFPALPKLLLSTTDLARLTLWNIPPGNSSFEAMVNSLAGLAKLKYLTVRFEYFVPLESRRPPPPTRTVLPALTMLNFGGSSECLEDLVAWIDAPLLDSITITFFHQFIYDISQLARFIRRTVMFEVLNEAREAHVDITFNYVHVEAFPQTRSFDGRFKLKISCEHLDWEDSHLRLSSLAPVFTSFFPSIYTVKHLYIHGSRYLPSLLRRYTENMEWLDFFNSFTAVKNLYIIEEFAQCIAAALQELVVERATNVLPALEGIFLEELEPSKSGPVKEAIGQFVAARRLLGHPVALSTWKTEYTK